MRYQFSCPEWKNGDVCEYDYPFDEKSLKQVLKEVLQFQHYKKGLDHIQNIKKPVVVDLGSYVGITPIFFAQHEGATIHAVEPNPYSFRSLVVNTLPYLRINAINCAVGVKEEVRHMRDDGDTIAMTLYGTPTDKQIEVNALPLDTLFERHKIKHVDLMKIDVENAEYEIFLSDGFNKVKDTIDFIIGEAHNDILPYQGVKTILEQKGFNVTYLPINNLRLAYDFKLSDNKIEHITIVLQTMFIAEHI